MKNQVAGILLTIGGTFILEPILVALARGVFHYDLNWLPTARGRGVWPDRSASGGSGAATTRSRPSLLVAGCV